MTGGANTEVLMQSAFDRALESGPTIVRTSRAAELVEQYKDKAEALGLELREMVAGVAVQVKCTRLCSTCANPPGRPCVNGASRQQVSEEDANG